jgi:hypothetical protein
LCRNGATPRLKRAELWEDDMGQYIQKMIRDEPITFVVMLLMIAILIFGAWDILHVVKRR